MPHHTQPSALEKIAGHPTVEAALTYVGALAGTPLAALLPVLTKSLASERQRERVERSLTEIDNTLRQHEELLRNLSDAQYKLINEVILSLLHTTDQEKFAYLRRAVAGALKDSELITQDASALSRIVRDISTSEVEFLLAAFQYKRVWLTTDASAANAQVLAVDPGSQQAVVVSGLLSLGLLVSGSSDYAGLGMQSWSPLAAKLIALLREQDA